MRMHQCPTAFGYGNAFGGSESEQRRKKIVTFVLLVILLISVSLFLGSKESGTSSLSSFRTGRPWKRRWPVRRRNYCSALHSGRIATDTGMLYIFESTGLHRVSRPVSSAFLSI